MCEYQRCLFCFGFDVYLQTYYVDLYTGSITQACFDTCIHTQKKEEEERGWGKGGKDEGEGKSGEERQRTYLGPQVARDTQYHHVIQFSDSLYLPIWHFSHVACSSKPLTLSRQLSPAASRRTHCSAPPPPSPVDDGYLVK